MRNSFGDRRFASPAAYTPVSVRNMSAIEANAAVTGFFPLDAFTYLIDHVHTFTGCNWWASIALSTIVMRTLILPLTIQQTKATYTYTLIWRQVKKIEDEIEKSRDNKSPIDEAVAVARKRKLLNQHGPHGLEQSTLTASWLTGAFVITLFSESTFRMVGKVESFKHGGALWFADLTTTDPTYILPLFTAFTFWAAMKCHNDALMLINRRRIYTSIAFLFAAIAPKVFMAFRRSVAARARLFYQHQLQQRAALPLSRIDRDDTDRRRQDLPIYSGSNVASFSFRGSRNLFGDRRFAIPAAYAPVFVRNMSSTGQGTENVAKLTDNLEMMTEGAEKATEAVAPVANEVATAATGFFPQDAFAYLIDHVHTFTGCNWWASIAITTILIRTLILPLTILQTKATYTYSLIGRQVDEIEDEINKCRNNKSPIYEAVAVARKREILNQYGLKQSTLIASLCGAASVIIMFTDATFKMVDTVESFKHGGALWFTDLTTRDPTYILPLLLAFTFWRAMECHNDGLNMRWSYALSIIIAACAPKAILFAWTTSNLYGLAYAMVMKKTEVKKMLGIPNIEEAPQYSPVDTLVQPASLIEMMMLSCVLFHVAFPSLHI